MSKSVEDTKMAPCPYTEDISLKDINRKDFLNKKIKNALNKKGKHSTSNSKKKIKSKVEKKYCKSQSGFETIDNVFKSFCESSAILKLNIPSDFMFKEIEGFTLLLTNLSQQTTSLGVISSCLLYIRSKVKTSLYKQIEFYIKALLMTSQSDSTPLWLESLRLIKTNWGLCKANKAFTQISKLLGLLVSVGMCDISNVTFDVGKFRLFEPNLNVLHMSTSDMIDAIFETIIYFAEGIYLCFKTRSFSPLLVSDRSCVENDEEYAKIMTWWNLVRNGNLEKMEGITDSEYQKRLDNLVNVFKNLSQSMRGLEKKIVYDRYMKLLSLQQEFITLKISNGIRHAPFALQFFGDSSQGKTTCADQLVNCLLASQGMSTCDTVKCTYNPGDKFMSNWTSDKIVLKFDDVANEKSDFVEKPPTRAIIDVINNEMYQAPKAEIEAKGKVFVEPWIVTATTNSPTLDAFSYSNCPYSIQRRLKRITVRADPKFCKTVEVGRDRFSTGIDPSKVIEYYTKDGVYSPPPFDDIWILTVEQAVQPPALQQVATYAPVTYKDPISGKSIELTNVDMRTVVNWAIDAFDKHRKEQLHLVSSKNARKSDIELCGVDNCNHIKGYCRKHFNSQFGVEDLSFNRFFNTLNNMSLLNQLPYYNMDFNKYIDNCILVRNYKSLFTYYLIFSCFLWFTFGLSWLYGNSYLTLCVLFTCFNLQLNMHVTLSNFVVDRYLRNNLLLQNLRKRNVQRSILLFTSLSTSCLIIYSFCKFWKMWRAFDNQGSLEPKDEMDVNLRDSEENIWASVVRRDLPISHTSKTVSTNQLLGVVDKNLVYGTIHLDEGNARMNALFLRSNVLIVPYHYFLQYGDELQCTFRKKNPDMSGGKFVSILHINSSYRVPNTDLMLCYTPNGGSHKDLMKHFPIGNLGETPFIMHWRNKSGEIVEMKGISKPSNVETLVSFRGGYYKTLNKNTFGGLCGATLVSDTIGSVIMGFHLGGTENTPNGCHGVLKQCDIISGINNLRNLEGVVLVGCDHVFPEEIYGINFKCQGDIHTKSPVNFMPQDTQITFHGRCSGRASSHSDFKVSLISEHVSDICGMPNIYNPPKFKPDWFGWQKCLSAMSQTGLPFNYKLLSKAVVDYKSALIPIFGSALWCKSKPLTDSENISGLDGKKFLDAIKLNTSIGYPLTGVKRKFVEEEIVDNKVIRKFDDIIMDEINRCENLYKQGLRAYTIAKACKKDEVLSGEKCRIFYGNSIALTFLIRKYYLPLVRVLQMNPLKSECAVGINCHSPEWDEFHKFVTKFGENRLIGGDYKNYDQRMPAQTILAALRILIDFAKLCDYTDEDITVMEALCADIVYAYIAYNGDLIGLTEGGHISGNSLTVIINGIVGALNLRMCFLELYPNCDFRTYVSLMTYGDDNIGSVSHEVKNFNITSISSFLDRHGQIYTMPNKTSALTDFLPMEEFEFLKRSSVYHSDLGTYLGALKDKSIFKSLHCYLRPKGCENTEEYACAINIDGALREWFNHGPSLYEHRRRQMIEIAERAGISHLCCELNLSYQDRINNWKKQYVS